MIQISLAVPCALLNLTKAKAPATAIPIPIFPLTKAITIATAAGIIVVVMKKLLLDLDLKYDRVASTAPVTNAQKIQMKKLDTVITPPSKIVSNSLSKVYVLLINIHFV